MATKKKQKDAKTGREKKLQTAKRSKKAASTTKTDESTGANVKRAVSTLQVEWPSEIDLSAFRRVVQDGVSPSDTAIRLQCRRCNQTEEILAKDALAISADNPPVGFPLEAFRDWARRAKKKHRRCGGAETKGTQQSLGLWEKIR